MPTITISLPSYVTELEAQPFERTPGVSGQVSQTVALTAGAGSIVVAATSSTWCWRFTEHGPGRTKTRFCVVTGDSTYAALVDLDPGTFVAAATPSSAAWEAIANSAVSAAAAAAPRTALYLAGAGVGDQTSSVQAVLDSAGPDEIVRLYGTFVISSTVRITKHLDASGAVFLYSGSGLAVQVGSTSAATQRRSVVLPRIVCSSKPTTGWVTGTMGVKITNAYACSIVVPHVQGFETNMLFYGENVQGTSYTTVFLGHLDNGKVNHKIDATTTGWANENTVIGGRMSHNTNEGVPCVGTKHIHITHPTGNSDPNNNRWIGTALESPGVCEWTVDAVGGAYNLWDHCRWEFTGGNSKVRWGATATRNTLRGGVGSEAIDETHVSGSSKNGRDSSTTRRFYGSGEASTIFENDFSSASPIITFMDAGGTGSGTDPATGYVARFTAQGWNGKRAVDTYARVKIDTTNARIYLGPGTSDAVAYLSGTAFAFLVNGAHLYSGSDGVSDFGAAASNRFRDANLTRYVRAGTAVVTGAGATGSRPNAVTSGAGAMWFDASIGKPIWSNGSIWVDATGASV